MKLTTAFVLFCALSATFAIPHDSLSAAAFTSWMHKHGKTFHHDEFQYRYKIWNKNNEWINAQNAQGNTYTLAMNEFGHLTPEEFRQQFNGLQVDSKDITLFASSPNKFSSQNTSLPESLDWREQGAVTPIKNQGQCGSCWSFSTTGSFEGCHFLKNKELVSFSEQNLVDCSGKYGNEGCNGGLMTSAMDYIIANGGLDTESSYPYKAVEGACQYDSKNNGGTLESYQNVPSGDEGALQQALAVGPVSVAIDASHMSFQFYKSGVYTSMFCSSENLDHGVLAVGWGTDSDSKKDYWIVKNSWGTTWGLDGYILMARNDNNMCGIATMATLPSC